jgi:hypothetical protein
MRRALGFTLVASVLAAGIAVAEQEPPVVLDLGPVVPTPAPSPKVEDKVRMITSFTMQNKPDGESIISFEATDFGRAKNDQHRMIATEIYTLVEPKKKKAKPLADDIVKKIRELERELLEYVEVVGPPRERVPITERGPSGRPAP